MKFKHVISTLALAMVTAFGVAAGIQPRSFKAVSADPEPPAPTYFYMVGSMNEWNTSSEAYPIQSNDMYGTSKLVHTFAKGDAFKIVTTLGTWDNQLNYGNVFGNGVLKASPCFVPGTGEGITNIVCDVAGTYWLRIAQNGPTSYMLFIDEEDNLTDFDTTTVYVQVKDWATTKIYLFDDTTYVNTLEFYGAYGGISVQAFSGSTDGVNFKGELGGIAPVFVTYAKGYKGNAKFIINNGLSGDDERKSGDLSINDGDYYWNTGIVGDSTHGAAARVVYDIYCAISYAGGSSLCNLTKDQAQDLVDEYNACEAQNIVNLTTFYTWAAKGSEDKANFTGAQVIAELTKIANKPEPSVLFNSPINTSAATGTVVIVVFATVAAISVGLFFMFKKRKEN